MKTLKGSQVAIVRAIEDNHRAMKDNHQTIKKSLPQVTQVLQKISKSNADSEAVIQKKKQDKLKAEGGYLNTFKILTD